MINIYFAKPSKSVDFIESVIKMTHITSNHHTQETKTVAKISHNYLEWL